MGKLFDWQGTGAEGKLPGWWEKTELTPGEFDKSIAGKLGISTCAVERKRNRLGLVRRKADSLGTTLTENIEQEVLAHKEEIIAKRDKQMLSRLLKEKARTELILGVVRDALEILPPLKVSRAQQGTELKPEHTEDVCLLLSDAEVGLTVKKDETGNLGDYNFDIFLKQNENLKVAVKNILNIHKKAYPIKKMHLALLGDMGHGSRESGAWAGFELEFGAMEQLLKVVQVIAGDIVYWSSLVEEIEVLSIPGNHGRIGRRGEEPHFENFDVLLGEILRIYFRENPQIKFDVDKSWFKVKKIRNTNCLFLHGDDTRGWMGIPFYGLARDAAAYQMLMRQFFDLICVGHFHAKAEVPVSLTTVKVNGCWVGGDVYSMKNLKVRSKRIQRLFGISNKGETWEYPIDLTREGG